MSTPPRNWTDSEIMQRAEILNEEDKHRRGSLLGDMTGSIYRAKMERLEDQLRIWDKEPRS